MSIENNATGDVPIMSEELAKELHKPIKKHFIIEELFQNMWMIYGLLIWWTCNCTLVLIKATNTS